MHISIEGFDGIGKTTAANLLAERLNFKLVEKPLKYLFDPNGGDKEYLRIRDFVNEKSPENRPFSACFYALGNIFLYEKFKDYDIVTDRHILSNYGWSGAPESEPIFDALYKTIGAPEYTFILYGDAEAIKSRLTCRDVNDSDLNKIHKSETIYEKMVSFAREHKMPHLVIDTRGKSPEEIVTIMLRELKEKGIVND